MRKHGSICSAAGLGATGHACWAFDRDEDFLDASLAFLEDGLRLGQRIAHVGPEPVGDQRERLGGLEDVAGLIDSGALQLFSLADLYRLGEPIDHEAQLAAYMGATEQALADGYTGLRVAAQVSDLVADPDLWDSHVGWESLADRQMASMPLAALCGYDRNVVTPALLGDLAAVHPASNGGTELSTFHLFGEPEALILHGEVDFSSKESFDRVLDRVFDGGAPATLDLGELDFIDHNCVRALARRAQAAPSDRPSIRNAPCQVSRLCELLGLDLPAAV